MAADAISAGKSVLAAILQQRNKDNLDKALRYLVTDHFQDPQQRVTFEMCERWLALYGQVLPREGVAHLLRGKPPGTVLQYQEFYDALLVHKSDDLEFQASLDSLREITAERRTGEALARGMSILRGGAWEGKDWLQGHEHARQQVLADFAGLDRELHLQDAPEGDVRTEGQEILDDYNRRYESSQTGAGVVPTGFPTVDKVLGGGQQRGELNILAAWTNAGKTSTVVAMVHHACVEGKNVVVFTSETLRSQVRFKLIARHSRHMVELMPSPPQQWLVKGLNARDIKAGTLDEVSPDARKALAAVVSDFGRLPGHCYVAQVPRGATISVIESKLARISRMFPVDLVVVDYLALLRSERRRNTRREELSDIVQEAKQLAATYEDGRGVPIISPWQINREGWEHAKEKGYYTLAQLAETAESASTADVVFTLLVTSEEPSGRAVPVKFQIIKNRDGARLAEPLEMIADFATCWFSAAQGGNTGRVHPGLGEYEVPPP